MSKLAVSIDGHLHEITLEQFSDGDTAFSITINGQTSRVTLPDPDAPPDKLEWIMVDNRPYQITFDRDLHWLEEYRGVHRIEVHDLESTVARPRSGDSRVKAPIPGLITRVLVAAGQHVTLDQPLIVLEAMKMENEIRASRPGVIAELYIKVGQTVVRNEVLAEIA